MLICCSAFLFSNAFATEPKNILLLNSFGWQLAWQQKIEEGFFPVFRDLSSQSEEPINLFIENLDVFRSKISKTQFFAYLQSKYANQPIDLILANDFASLDFVDKYLWEGLNKPQVFAFADKNSINQVKNIENLGYIAVNKIRFSDTIGLILELHPKTKEIIAVTGKSANSLRFKKMLEGMK